MTEQDAENKLLVNSGFIVADDNTGLIGRLRPYEGLRELDFVEIVESILVLRRKVNQSGLIDARIAGALWWICDRSRVLVLDLNSSVRTNAIAGSSEVSRLRAWVEVIESMSNRMLQNRELPIVMFQLLEFIANRKLVDSTLYLRFVETIRDCVQFDDPDIAGAASLSLSVLEPR